MEASRLTYMEGIIRHQIKLNEFEQKISEDVVEYSNNIEKVRKEIDDISEKNEQLESRVTNYQKE